MPALLRDHTATWAAASLHGEHMVRVRHNALPYQLFEAVMSDAQQVFQLSSTVDHFNKRSTWWMPLRNQRESRRVAESAIEAAILELFRLDFGVMEQTAASASAELIAGAEWWVQSISRRESIGFHYDKDEGMATTKMTMSFPEVSTITYLTSHGAPTLVLNQTTPDGNGNDPELPRRAWLTSPVPNKHVLFRGNLQHGVHGLLSPDDEQAPAASASRRLTLLINWWREQPLEPNCIKFGSDRWRSLGLWRTPKELKSLHASRPPSASSLEQIDDKGTQSSAEGTPWRSMPLLPDATRREMIEWAPTDMFFFDVAKPLPPGKDWSISWSRHNVLGPIARLDLDHRSCVSSLFQEIRPKLFFVLLGQSGTSWAADRLPKWIQDLEQTYERDFKFVLADPRHTGDFMRVFGLSVADAPTVVIHDSKQDLKLKLSKPMYRASVRDFIKSFLQNQRRHGTNSGTRKEEL
mmetsp:Transcript_9830/g.16341  ORF Transcript_9830/g.16341 Transcript_9830/m.16341 type:complete len:465 (-) Transcript_9830:373-1767(-)